MNNISRVLKQNIFYVALGVGAIALIAMVAIYTLRTGNKSEDGQNVNLNESVDLANGDEVKYDIIETEEVIGKITNDIVDNTTEEINIEENTMDEATTQEEVTEETAEVMSNNAEALIFNSENGLGWPLVGNVILPYSMDTTIYFQTLEQYRCNPGMLIQGEVGKPVMASAEGEVISIENNKEYGNIITVDMGSGYKAIYGQLDSIVVHKGDTVVLGTQLGQVANPTSYYEKEGAHLYFAITKDGTPINPMTLVSE